MNLNFSLGIFSKVVLGLSVATTLFSCQGSPLRPQYLAGEQNYEEVLDRNTKRKEVYSGLHNAFTAAATIRRTEVLKSITDRKAEVYQWDENTYRAEYQKETSYTPGETQVFVSFYTPERKHDDLHRNQTLWKTFLDVDGRRYEGRATKIKLLPSEITNIYPQHSRFATPYMIAFPVSTSQVDGRPAKLTITGPVGSMSLEF